MSKISFEIIVDSRFLSDRIWIKEIKHKKSINWNYLCYEYNWNEYKDYKELPEKLKQKIQKSAIKHIINRQNLINKNLENLFSWTENKIITLEKPREIFFSSEWWVMQYRWYCSIYKQPGKQKITLNDIYRAVNSTWEAVVFITK